MTEAACREWHVGQAGCGWVGGGVAANGPLREELTRRCSQAGMHLFLPPRVLCTDNAAMVASAGLYYLTEGWSRAPQGLELNAQPGLAL